MTQCKNGFNLCCIVYVVMLCGLFSPKVFALEDPVLFTERVSKDLFSLIKDNNKTEALNQHITSYVDFDEISVWIAGQKNWRAISEEEKTQFKQALKTFIVNSYVQTLMMYVNDNLKFKKPPSEYDTKKRILVKSVLYHQDNPIPLSFRLIKKEDAWKVYDITTDGVSLLSLYQAQFSQRIQREGIEQITNEIKHFNSSHTSKKQSNHQFS